MTQMVKIADIHSSQDLSCRAKVNDETVLQYAADMEEKVGFPPIILYRDPNKKLWLADGTHRIQAAVHCGFQDIEAEIREGSFHDAFLEGIQANKRHGLRPSAEDRNHQLAIILEHPLWRDWSDRKIADVVGVSHPTVAAFRKTAGGKFSNTEGDGEPKKRQGKDGKTYNASKPPRKPDPSPSEPTEGQTFDENDPEPSEPVEASQESPLPVVSAMDEAAAFLPEPEPEFYDEAFAGLRQADNPLAMKAEFGEIRKFLKSRFDRMPAGWHRPFAEMLKGLAEILK